MVTNRRFTCVLIPAMLWFTATIAPHAKGDSLLNESFESYAPGSNLDGQGGWTGGHADLSKPGVWVVGGASTIPIDSGAPFSSQFVNGYNGTPWALDEYSHSLSHALDPLAVTTLTFDAYAIGGASYNSGLGYNLTNLTWYRNSPAGGDGWIFDAREITGNLNNFIDIPDGGNKIVHMGIVVNGTNDTVYGTYDFGAGTQLTPTYSVTSAEIAALNTASFFEDHRFGWHGNAYDNINIVANAPSVPEGNSLLSFGGMVVTSGLFLLRKRRKSYPYLSP